MKSNTRLRWNLWLLFRLRRSTEGILRFVRPILTRLKMGRFILQNLFLRSLPNILAEVILFMGGVRVRPLILLYSFLLCLTSIIPCAAQQSTNSKFPPIPYTPGLDVTAMDTSVDPCVDFYAYSCGGWQKKNPIPPDQSSWSVYSKLQDENRTLLRSILENAAVNDPHRGPINQKIGDFYASCMDEAAVNEAGAAALKPDLDRIAAMKSKADLAQTLAYLHSRDIGIYFGNAALFRFGSEQDAKNSSEVIAGVDQGGLGLPDRDYYLKDDVKSQAIRAKYVAHVQKMFELLGESSVAAAADAQTVMRIETALAKAAMTRVQRRDPKNVYHRMTVQ